MKSAKRRVVVNKKTGKKYTVEIRDTNGEKKFMGLLKQAVFPRKNKPMTEQGALTTSKILESRKVGIEMDRNGVYDTFQSPS